MQKFLISCLESRIESDGGLYARYIFGPFPRGKATTVASGLRRSLLAEVPGYAITGAEIVGVQHEYSVIPGTRESVIDILLNLKKLIFTSSQLTRTRAIGYISVRGPGKITGRDIRLPPGLQCVNPDQTLAVVAADGFVNIKVAISSGTNYVLQSGSSLDGPRQSNGVYTPTTVRSYFPVDAVFMPVTRVNFSVHSDEDVLDFPLHVRSLDVTERVIFEVWTNGTVTPREALHYAATSLIRNLNLFRMDIRRTTLWDPSEGEMLKLIRDTSDSPHTLKPMYDPNSFLMVDVGILPLNSVAYAAFKERKICRLGDLINYSYDALLQIPGMSPEAVFGVLCFLRPYGIQLRPHTSPVPAGD